MSSYLQSAVPLAENQLHKNPWVTRTRTSNAANELEHNHSISTFCWLSTRREESKPNIKKINNKTLGIVAFGAALFTTLTFLTNGLYTLSELRENYLAQELAEFYNIGAYNIYMRYISFLFFSLLLFAIYQLAQQQYLKFNSKIPFEILLHTAIIWVTSSELLNWMDLSGSEQSYKLGLSILWGIYALLLIGLGIWKKKKHLRIGAIVLFSITLVKLFFYDISSLNTISKTIVFVSLGVLLLIISFLYNKYKHIIFDETKL